MSISRLIRVCLCDSELVLPVDSPYSVIKLFQQAIDIDTNKYHSDNFWSIIYFFRSTIFKRKNTVNVATMNYPKTGV